jgi:hypothetical protein
MELNTELKDNISHNGKRTNVDVEYEEFIDGEVKKIIPYKNPQVVLKEFFVDKNTFDDIFLDNKSVISQAEGVIKESKDIVDKEIVPLSLKLTDQTIFLLRKTTKIEKIKELFETGQEEDINDEIKDLSKDDAIDFIKKMTRKDWEKLYPLKETIKEIGEIFRKKNMPVTATDIRLVSCLINDKVLDSANALSGLEKAIVDWLLSVDYKKQREEAARFFSLAWEHSINEKMPKDEGYFDKLPQHEDISSSTKQIGGKLYRDHLNHNIRAALMASFLLSVFRNNNGVDVKEDKKVAFYSGLLHDIAHSLSSFEGTIQIIQENLQKLIITRSLETNSIIDRDLLKKLVNTVAFIASIPDIKDNEIPVPWDSLHGLLDMVNKELFYEEIICALNYEHSFLSAAVVFNAAVYKVLGGKRDSTSFYDGVNHLFKKKKPDYNDLFQIIQCIALHDRKSTGNYKGFNRTRQITALDMKNFFLPVITIIADEIQEWGRPISADEHSLVTDCIVGCNDNENIKVEFTCKFEKEILKEAQYCFLEHFFSKVIMFSRLKNDKDKAFTLELQIDITDGLEISSGTNFLSELKLTQLGNDVLWPHNASLSDSIQEEKDKRLIAWISYPSGRKNIISSFIVYETSSNNLIHEIKEILCNTPQIGKVVLSEKSCEIVTKDNILIKGNMKYYRYTVFQEQSIIHHPHDNYEILKNIGILFLELTSVDKTQVVKPNQTLDEDLHLLPQPHFLDLDWRFSYKSINSILKFVSENVKSENDKRGKVCYLGCPSLALYHSRQIKEMDVDFTLFDKGHFALEKWLEKKCIDEKNYFQYDATKKIPGEYLHKYDMVIMDPPWYEEFYESFLTRAVSFVRENGLIGFVDYPGYPGQTEKVRTFSEIKEKLFGNDSNFTSYCSLEVAYHIPGYEEVWQGHKEFVHSAIDTYRPAYMEFYLVSTLPEIENINNTKKVIKKLESLYYSYNSEDIQDYEYEGGYVKLKKDINTYFSGGYHWNFKTREKLERIKSKKDKDYSWVGWSTNNTLIFADESPGENTILNPDELLKQLAEYEKTLN